MANETQGLPVYQCHKQVRALKISSLTRENTPAGVRVTILDAEGRAVFVGDDYMDRHKPHVGGYFVRYSDGYQSFSPANTFEEGYQRIG